MAAQPRSGLCRKKNAIEVAYQEARADPTVRMWFADEASFHRQPTVAREWWEEGERQPRARWHAGEDSAFRVAAALDPVQGTVWSNFFPQLDAGHVGEFYQALAAACPGARCIHLVLDNWPVHHNPRALAALAALPQVHLLWLPTYAPWLNPCEKVWKWTRQHLTHMHRLAEHPEELHSRLGQTLRRATASPNTMRRYTGTGKSNLYSS